MAGSIWYKNYWIIEILWNTTVWKLGTHREGIYENIMNRDNTVYSNTRQGHMENEWSHDILIVFKALSASFDLFFFPPEFDYNTTSDVHASMKGHVSL